MAGKARSLARLGYRAILVSLRGYCGSTGNERTFTVLERIDLKQTLDALSERGLIAGRVGVWGMSYGAATALAWAGEDDRVQAVVAVASFSSMRAAVPDFAHSLLPLLSLGKDDAWFQTIVDLAGQQACFDPDDADIVASVAKAKAPILLMHGTWDAVVPFPHGERLAAAAGPTSHFLPIEGAGHITIWMDLDGQVERETAAWFERWLDRE